MINSKKQYKEMSFGNIKKKNISVELVRKYMHFSF